MVLAIFHYYQYNIRIMDEYYSELEYETKQFTETIYRSHRQVVDNLKWQNCKQGRFKILLILHGQLKLIGEGINYLVLDAFYM